MTYAKRIDANQPEIVKALREFGCTVECLHAVGKGVPDLLCAVANEVFLIEVKDGSKIPSKQALTVDQIVWHREWKAVVHVVNSVEVALAVAEQYKRRSTMQSTGA